MRFSSESSNISRSPESERVEWSIYIGRGRASAACLYWSGPDHRYPQGSAMQLPRPCLTCQKPTEPGQSRCPDCLRIVRRKWDEPSRLRRQQRIKGGGAARRLRYAVNKHGSAECAACGNNFHAQDIEIDHIIPLGQGGPDTEDNIRPLCKGCHSLRALKLL